MTKHTYTHNAAARTIHDHIVTIPDAVYEDQRGWANAGNHSFLLADGRRARLNPEAYGLFTTGTGDTVVTIL